MLGIQDSDAAIRRDPAPTSESTSASASPPPVWTSKIAFEFAIRLRNSREYFHEGRSSVARPSNHEKSQPSVGSEFPSVINCSNLASADMRPLSLGPTFDTSKRTLVSSPIPSRPAEPIRRHQFIATALSRSSITVEVYRVRVGEPRNLTLRHTYRTRPPDESDGSGPGRPCSQ